MALHGQRWRAVTDDTVTAFATQAEASAMEAKIFDFI
jgi:hypothetical protein